jgi:dTDP-4-dehydrorhamnose reductase
VETIEITECTVAVWVILGGYGQLGSSFHDVLTVSNIPFQVLSRSEADITKRESLFQQLAQLQPSVIVNCAAWTAVDDAEDFQSEAFAINADGARNVAIAARQTSARLVHISTDYVFDGEKASGYLESDETNPLSAYGITKLAGEKAVIDESPDSNLVVRTAWLYSSFGKNFVKTMTKKALLRQRVNVVNDQVGQPTFATDLVRHIFELVANPHTYGIFHGTNSGTASWYELTVMIYKHLGVETSLVSPVNSTEFPTRAIRPKNSVLLHTRAHAFNIPEMRHWTIALGKSIEAIKETVLREIENES